MLSVEEVGKQRITCTGNQWWFLDCWLQWQGGWWCHLMGKKRKGTVCLGRSRFNTRKNDKVVFPGNPVIVVLNYLEGPYQHGWWSTVYIAAAYTVICVGPGFRKSGGNKVKIIQPKCVCSLSLGPSGLWAGYAEICCRPGWELSILNSA